MAHAVWATAGRSWTPWTTWTSGAYRAHLAEAQAALETLRGSSIAGVALPVGCGPVAGSSPLPAAVPITGPDGYVPDPTSTGRITRRMLHVYTEINRVFGGWRWGAA